MRATGIIATALAAVTLAGCASESYYGPASSYPYRSQAYAPAYTTTYYASPAYSPRRGYDGYWDYQRNYRGIHSAPEL